MKAAVAILSVCLTITAFGCLVWSDNPVGSAPEYDVDPGPYLGTWNLVALGEQPITEPQHIDIEYVDGTLRAAYSTGEETQIVELNLTQIDTIVVASMKNPEDGQWGIAEVVLTDQGATLELRSMNHVQLYQDVEDGLLSGVTATPDVAIHTTRITATSAELRSYIASSTDLFTGGTSRLERIQ